MTEIVKKPKSSIWSKIGTFFGILFSGIVMIIGFLVATPFFLLSILFNWIKLSFGFTLFWFIANLIYTSVILDSQKFEPFNGTIVLIIIGLGLLTSIFVTISEMKE